MNWSPVWKETSIYGKLACYKEIKIKQESKNDIKYGKNFPDSKVHVAHMGPTWVLSAPGGPHVGPMLAHEPCNQGCLQIVLLNLLKAVLILGLIDVIRRWSTTMPKQIPDPAIIRLLQSKMVPNSKV